jgi:hypothetical protein
VREIEAHDIEPRIDHAGEYLALAGGGAEGADDLGAAKHGEIRIE